ncbi:MFS general substrate transporter [Chlorella sorokiniana]|uniref:MFS general substrate transporter n=1 Tax=Chlorella sorokiniana TaxID=3076 RepID=A0A2P6THF6_CHLSO|nr:MFS general substrate transporter [Chlorella sorokiniana]|eukprot:PRW33724.1 MFS general substrate transporter [Chlorella sorokiniana]
MFIGKSLNASLSQLGTLTLVRALFQALTSPISGLVGDRYDRSYVVAFGCLLWGVMTAAIGLSRSLGQAFVSCAVNGFGLALVIPCVSSIIADYNPPDTRGRAFGIMSLTASLGGMAGAFYATNVGATRPFGMEGWRFAFLLVAVISVVTAALVYRYAVDPRHLHHHPSLHGGSLGGLSRIGSGIGASSKGQHDAGSSVFGPAAAADVEGQRPGLRSATPLTWQQVMRDVRSVLGIRSFQIIVLQGIVGSIPWVAMTWFTTWLQLLGFSDLYAASLMATFSIGCALGGLLGGTLGDRLGRRLPNSPHGRVLVNQFSVLIGMPMSFLLLKGLPYGGDMAAHYGVYGMVLFLFGLCISWCGCNNSALFSELVPEEQRSTIFAFDRSFEGAVGAMGAPLVGLAAERVFGFRGVLGGGGDGALDHNNVAALSSALLVCMVGPWVLCLLSFTALHWTFKEDRRRAFRRTNEDSLAVEERPLVEAAAVRKRTELVARQPS